MKKFIAAAAIVLSATAGAYADSSALDVYEAPAVQHGVDYTATSSIGQDAFVRQNPRLGDGATVVDPSNRGAGLSVTAPAVNTLRLGDGAPA